MTQIPSSKDQRPFEVTSYVLESHLSGVMAIIWSGRGWGWGGGQGSIGEPVHRARHKATSIIMLLRVT
jgi:hypothetical protein